AWDCLNENGVLIYSTCSYSTEENEDIIDYVLNQFACESLRLPLDASWNIIETRSEKANGYGYRFYPDRINGEGFFLAVVQKKSGVTGIRKVKEKWEIPNKQEE